MKAGTVAVITGREGRFPVPQGLPACRKGPGAR
jgi:hypothetical protein